MCVDRLWSGALGLSSSSCPPAGQPGLLPWLGPGLGAATLSLCTTLLFKVSHEAARIQELRKEAPAIAKRCYKDTFRG